MLIAPTETDGLVFAGLLGKMDGPVHGRGAPLSHHLTTTPNQPLSGVQSRMPVIIPAFSWSRWLDSDATGDECTGTAIPRGRPCSPS